VEATQDDNTELDCPKDKTAEENSSYLKMMPFQSTRKTFDYKEWHTHLLCGVGEIQ
jgi:hypothetical protein